MSRFTRHLRVLLEEWSDFVSSKNTVIPPSFHISRLLHFHHSPSRVANVSDFSSHTLETYISFSHNQTAADPSPHPPPQGLLSPVRSCVYRTMAGSSPGLRCERLGGGGGGCSGRHHQDFWPFLKETLFSSHVSCLLTSLSWLGSILWWVHFLPAQIPPWIRRQIRYK